jgi:LysM repeat protein
MKKIMFSVYFGVSILVAGAQETAHVVTKGETLYSLSKKYGVSISEISKANNFTTQYELKLGQRIAIPAKSIQYKSAVALSNAKVVPAKVHTVGKGETFYAICKKYGVTVAEMKQWNQLSNLNLKQGQKLIVNKANSIALYKPISVPSTPDTPWREEDIRPRTAIPAITTATAGIEEEKIVAMNPPVVETAKPIVITGLKTSSSNAAEYAGIFNQYSTQGYKIKRSKGAANYLDEATSGNQNLAFYSNAEMGSVIRVTNLMNHKTVFVKVVGKVPPIDAGSDITVKLSSKAAKDLGALDEKFLVEVASFGSN